MDEITHFFRETDNAFTIYVVEQKFVVGRGADYFKSYKGKENYIDSNKVMKNRLNRILIGINKKIPESAELIKKCFGGVSPTNIIEIITALSKIFTTQEHQAAGPNVIDPIIIQEGNILQKYVNQLIELHKTSILRPVIIILLKDNDFERAKIMLSNCPHGTNIKLIRNNGKSEIFKIVNCGVNNPQEFMDAFSHQCFNTCSNTKRDMLYNKDWSEKSIIRFYGPIILQLRTRFLYNDKSLVRNDLNNIIDEISLKKGENDIDDKLLKTFECVLKLYRVFCNDGGKQDIMDAYTIAKNLDNEILLAHVYKYAYFFDGFTFNEKISFLDKAYNIFLNNNMEDNAIYCKNNKLVRFFDTDAININEFLDLLEESINNVPGLVGMSHIYNNVGVAHLMSGFPDESINYFLKGLDYAYRPERCIQKTALICNKFIAQTYSFLEIDEKEIYKAMNSIFDNNELLNIPFISSRFVLNLVTIMLNQSLELGINLLKNYPVAKLIENAFNDNPLGSGQLLLQLDILNKKYYLEEQLNIRNRPSTIIPVTGLKRKFIEKTGLNPFIFSTWF